MGGTHRTRNTRRTRNTTSRGSSRSGHAERVQHETHKGHNAGTWAGQRAMGMGQWGRQHEQFYCCFRETLSVHPAWPTQGSGRSRHHSSERRKSIRNAINKVDKKNRVQRCPNGSAAYRCHHCGVGYECACWPGNGLKKRRGWEVCLPRTSSGSGHSSPCASPIHPHSKNCLFENMLPGLLELRSDQFTKSALSCPSPSPLPPLQLPPGAAVPSPHRSSPPQRSLSRLPSGPAVDPRARLTPPPAPL